MPKKKLRLNKHNFQKTIYILKFIKEDSHQH